VRFELKQAKHAGISTVRYQIYSQQGTLVEDKILAMDSLPSTTEWYWQPTHASHGLYVYKIMLLGDGQEVVQTFNGKVIVMK